MTVTNPRISVEKLLSLGIISLCIASFGGNKFIAAGQALLLIGIAWWLVNNGIKGLAPLPASAWMLLLFGIVVVGSVLINLSEIERPVSVLKRARYYLLPAILLAIPLFGALLTESTRLRNWCFIGWVVMLVAAILVGAVTMFTGNHPFRGQDVFSFDRMSGLYGHVMQFAYSIQFSVVAIAALVLNRGIYRRITSLPFWILFPLLGLAGIALFLTYTRGALLGAVVGLMVVAVMRSRWFVLAIVVSGLIAGGLFYGTNSRYLDFENSDRLLQWKAASLSFVENPVKGLGFRQFEVQSSELKKRYGLPFEKFSITGLDELIYFRGNAHNNYLEAFASMGIFGGLGFLAFCFLWWREVSRSPETRVIVFPLIVTFLVSGLFENTFFNSETKNTVLLIYLLSQISLAAVGPKGSVDPIQESD